MLRLSPSLLAVIAAAFALQVQAADVRVVDPYARAVPPGQPNSAVFMQIENRDTKARALVSAASSAAKVVELHTHVKEGGMMQMRRIGRIELPAGGTVSLVPGGLHVMLIGLVRPLAEGDEVELTLRYDDGSATEVKAPVRAIGVPKSPHGHSGG